MRRRDAELVLPCASDCAPSRRDRAAAQVFRCRASGNQDDRARRLAALEIAVGLCGLCEWVGAADLDGDLTFLHDLEQIPRSSLQLLTGCDVRRQSWTRDVERALGRQNAKLYRRYRARCIAERDHQAARLE